MSVIDFVMGLLWGAGVGGMVVVLYLWLWGERCGAIDNAPPHGSCKRQQGHQGRHRDKLGFEFGRPWH